MGLFVATGKLPINLGVAILLLFVAAFAGNVVGYEIGRKLGPAIYRHDGRIVKRRYWEQSEQFLRAPRQQGARHRPVRAVRPHLRHRRRGDQPHGPPPVLHLVGGRAACVVW